MRIFILFALLALPHTLMGNEGVLVTPSNPGSRLLSVSIPDTLKLPDLSKISIEGHEIENIIVVQENDSRLRTILADNVIDISDTSKFRIINYVVSDSTLIVECPSYYTWERGYIVIDTSFGGLAQRVVYANLQKNLPTNSVWELKLTKVSMLDIIAQCDISFISRLSLSVDLSDTVWSDTLTGRGIDSTVPGRVTTRYNAYFHSFRANLTPIIEGRLRIEGGHIVLNQFKLKGSCNLTGQVVVQMQQPGTFSLHRSVSPSRSFVIPLAKGIFIKSSISFDLNLTMAASQPAYIASIDINHTQELDAHFINKSQDWLLLQSGMHMVEGNRLLNVSADKPTPGSFSLGFKSTIKEQWLGMQGLGLFLLSGGHIKGVTAADSISLNSTLAWHTSASYLGLPHNTRHGQQPVLMEQINRVISTPPRIIPRLEILKKDTANITLSWLHLPETKGYTIYVDSDSLSDTLAAIELPPFIITRLKPNTAYNISIKPYNIMGSGPAVSISCTTNAINLPPSAPRYLSPEVNSITKDSTLNISWSSSDPDSLDTLRYTLLLDTLNPPRRQYLYQSTRNTFIFRPEEGGHTYYWCVTVTDGLNQVSGSVWSFHIFKADNQITLAPRVLFCLKDVTFIPAGIFVREDNQKVKIQSFYINRYEVTQNSFVSILSINPSYRKGNNLPVENVSWSQASNYCREINGRLPTEAEWEYAARAGTQSNYYWQGEPVNAYAWYYKNSLNQTHPVGQKLPNNWGLYDMSGNVFEWVQDWYGNYSPYQLLNPQGPQAGNSRVTRGGSWFSDISSLKSSSRFKNRPAFTSYKLGFRCAFSADQLPKEVKEKARQYYLEATPDQK